MTKTVLIIGAGLTGLYVGWHLCKQGFNVTLLERQNFVGGLATSLKYNGYIIDIGPHYISLPRYSEITKDVENLIGSENLIEIPNIHKAFKSYFDGKLLNSDPTLYDVIFNSSLNNFIHGVSDFIFSKIKNKFSTKKPKTAKEYLILNFGSFSYEKWFKPYYQKIFLDKEPPIDLVKKQFPPPSFKQVSFSFLKKTKKKTRSKNFESQKSSESFDCYYRYGMISLINELENQIKNFGGKIILGAEVTSILHGDQKKVIYEKGGKKNELLPDSLIYATPLSITVKWFTEILENNQLRVFSPEAFNSIMTFLFIDKPKVYNGWIISVFDKNVIFARISQQNFLSDSIVPKGKTLLNIEIKLSESNPFWKLDESSIFERVKHDLGITGILKNEKIDGYKIIKFKNLYPAPKSGSKNNFGDIIKLINTFKNEYTIDVQSDSGELVSSEIESGNYRNNRGSGGVYNLFSASRTLIQKFIKENEQI